MTKHPSFITWSIVHILFPLSPIFLGALIRACISSDVTWTTFDASNVAVCLALLSLFVYQSLLRTDRPLTTEDKKRERYSFVFVFVILAIFMIGLFAALISTNAFAGASATSAETAETYERALQKLALAVYCFSGFVVALAMITQQYFRLEAKIL